MPTHTFRGRIDKLEIARGYDGLFRGPPDPVLAIGVYASYGPTVRLLGRSLHRFQSRKSFPGDVESTNPELPAGVLQLDGPFAFVMVAIALEEDGGTDVQRMFGALERHDEMTFFAPKQREVEPLGITAIIDTWRSPHAVELCLDGTPAPATCRSDKWIGAVCWAMTPRPDTPASLYRLPFLAADGRNDWTALVSIAH